MRYPYGLLFDGSRRENAFARRGVAEIDEVLTGKITLSNITPNSHSALPYSPHTWGHKGVHEGNI